MDKYVNKLSLFEFEGSVGKIKSWSCELYNNGEARRGGI
jgi:hypothetical protein